MLKAAHKSHVITSNNWLWCRLWAWCQSPSCFDKLCRLFRAVVTMLIRVNQPIIMTAENRGNSHQLGSHAAEPRLRQEAPCWSCSQSLAHCQISVDSVTQAHLIFALLRIPCWQRQNLVFMMLGFVSTDCYLKMCTWDENKEISSVCKIAIIKAQKEQKTPVSFFCIIITKKLFNKKTIRLTTSSIQIVYIPY